uniref:hypothetical protein n=1 Tax=unclassified Vibrio TaxID=2614977 RepID=UPI001595FBBA|nr:MULTISPECIES: hypothetical protein [unclassified Vibrio]
MTPLGGLRDLNVIFSALVMSSMVIVIPSDQPTMRLEGKSITVAKKSQRLFTQMYVMSVTHF